MGMPRPAFPRTLREFQSMFATEEACQKYLAECRWPDGFVCTQCGNHRSYQIVKARRWQWTDCRYQVSLDGWDGPAQHENAADRLVLGRPTS